MAGRNGNGIGWDATWKAFRKPVCSRDQSVGIRSFRIGRGAFDEQNQGPAEYISGTHWDAPQGYMLHILQHRKLQVLQGIQVDCWTDRQVNGQYCIPYRKVCHISYPVMSISADHSTEYVVWQKVLRQCVWLV